MVETKAINFNFNLINWVLKDGFFRVPRKGSLLYEEGRPINVVPKLPIKCTCGMKCFLKYFFTMQIFLLL